MQDISGFGLRVRVVASSTFPAGITLSSFADDSDPFDFPAHVITETAMGVNGDLVWWSRANPLLITLNLIPHSEDDQNMSALQEANRVGMGKNSARDEITLSAVYPDGRTITLSRGKLTSGHPGRSVASSGRMKAKTYTFAFEQMTRT